MLTCSTARVDGNLKISMIVIEALERFTIREWAQTIILEELDGVLESSLRPEVLRGWIVPT